MGMEAVATTLRTKHTTHTLHYLDSTEKATSARRRNDSHLGSLVTRTGDINEGA